MGFWNNLPPERNNTSRKKQDPEEIFTEPNYSAKPDEKCKNVDLKSRLVNIHNWVKSYVSFESTQNLGPPQFNCSNKDVFCRVSLPVVGFLTTEKASYSTTKHGAEHFELQKPEYISNNKLKIWVLSSLFNLIGPHLGGAKFEFMKLSRSYSPVLGQM